MDKGYRTQLIYCGRSALLDPLLVAVWRDASPVAAQIAENDSKGAR